MGGQKIDVLLLSGLQHSAPTPRGQVIGLQRLFFELFAVVLEDFVRCFIFYVSFTSFWRFSQHSSDIFLNLFLIFIIFLKKRMLPAGPELGTALPLRYLEMNFKG